MITMLIGNSTNHSLSPVMYDFFACQSKDKHLHLKVDIKDKKDLPETIETLRTCRINANITLPYKSEVIKYLDQIDPEARNIGAVNTIVNRDGQLIGYNSDCFGAIKSLEIALDRAISNEDHALVLGTGGVARALTYGLLQKTNKIVVCYRKPASYNTKSFIKDFGGKVKIITYDEALFRELTIANIICNATSAGMYPDINRTPLKASVLQKISHYTNLKKKIFFDVIFNPEETLFLKNAKKFGAKIQNGIDMMIYQGILSYKIWTKKYRRGKY